jgi:serine/threonine-protein kinase HipA
VADAGQAEHPGFERAEVLERGADFIEYAHQRGAWIAGGSGAGGDAPKLLLREDERGMLHADGALADARTRQTWFVKFPRSSRDVDRMILRAEAAYHRIAARLGARTSASPTWEADSLFMLRFDRVVQAGRVDRLGFESLYALAGVTDWGATVSKEVLAEAVARFATDPRSELEELVLRDILDVALGNTDNHGRNTAVSKNLDGTIALSPIYDLAPMVLDPQGIARVCRWRVEDGSFPDYAKVAEDLGRHGVEVSAMKRWLVELGDRIAQLPAMMKEEDVPAFVVDTLEPRAARVAGALRKVR